MKTFALVIAIATIAATVALPAEDVVPEADDIVMLSVTHEDQKSWEAAKTQLMSMKEKGLDDSQCRKLADDTEAEVRANVKAEQDTLEKADKGEKCPDEHKQAVQDAKDAKDQADQAEKEAKKAYEDASTAKINFGDFQFDTLVEGQCAIFFNKAVYQDQKAKVKQLKDAYENAKGAAVQAGKDLETAKEDQKKAINKCYCDVKKAHKTFIESVNSGAKEANTKAWTQAAHLRCVLDGTPIDKCAVTDIPVVVAVKLTDAAEAADCSTHAKDSDILSTGKSCTMSPNWSAGGHSQWPCSNAIMDTNRHAKCGWSGDPTTAISHGDNKFWQVDLGTDDKVTSVEIQPFQYSQSHRFVQNIYFEVCKKDGGVDCIKCGGNFNSQDYPTFTKTDCPSDTVGRYVRMVQPTNNGHNIHICRIFVHGHKKIPAQPVSTEPVTDL